MSARVRAFMLAVVAGLALADASIVTLALPELLVELDTSVEGVAAVLGVYTAVLAVALLPARWLIVARGAAIAGAAEWTTEAAPEIVRGAAGGDALSVRVPAGGVRIVELLPR